MNWVVTVKNGAQSHKYWVEAEQEDDARARGYRLHCASENWRQAERVEVTECRQIT